ncbi:hypothetical protein CFN78_02300 [Amycolatopsis antarctica]|uniref:Uncharacterized protein n=1 Tax=Amycolatopsis antarctica TaxID=1854586 RepID=A0A263DC10_9PSEU|nr:hypothetical protein [Amycolatopsis antarctica]OZM75036.1 hypothetical protein CFN78_02300 [Amycolatopsis antarctica]
MWRFGGARLWRSAYLRAVRSAFATVPLYRETWALSGRTEPVLVPGKTGVDGGALSADLVARTLVDTVPLAGGSAVPDAARGLGGLLPHARGGSADLVVVVDADIARPPADLSSGTRGCLLHPDSIIGSEQHPALREITDTLRRNESVLAVGDDKALDTLATALRAEPEPRWSRVPHRRLDQLDGGPYGLLHDPLLGYLGVLRDCGRWHVDWRRVHVRSTTGGLAFTVLGRTSPRLVDVLACGGVHGEVAPCPRHGTPVVLT